MPTETDKISTMPNDLVEKWQLPAMDSADRKVFRREVKARSEPARKSGSSDEESQTSIPTAQEIEAWYQQAHDEGYQQGKLKAEKEVADLKQQVARVIGFFQHPLQFLNEEVEQQLNLLAVTLAQQLVRREIRAEPGEIIAVIREAVKMLPVNSRKIRIFLHPEDADIVRSTLQLDEDEDEQNWKLVEDRMITRGGCEIKSDQSVINATLENRLQALAASILGGEREEDLDASEHH